LAVNQLYRGFNGSTVGNSDTPVLAGVNYSLRNDKQASILSKLVGDRKLIVSVVNPHQPKLLDSSTNYT
jgi:hypothetical protein